MLEDITPFIVMEVLERAQEIEKNGDNVIHLEVGEPDFNVPYDACEAVVCAVRNGWTHYTHSLGMLELRRRLRLYTKRSVV